MRPLMFRVRILLSMMFALLVPEILDAQSGPRVEIHLPTAAQSMTVQLHNPIDGGRFEELLRSGFDVSLNLRAELWRTGRIFHSVVSSEEWNMIVHYDQFDQTFDVARIDAAGVITPLGTYRLLAHAKAALTLPYSPSVGRPSNPGQKYYYNVRVDIGAVDLNDLDEVGRWLRGELSPAVQGRRNPGTALGRGLQTLVTRMMGGEVRRLEARSPRFELVVSGTP